MDRAEKREFVAWLNGAFKESGSVVVAHYTGLTVSQMSDLRSKMRDAGGSVKVAKNRLAKIALQGTESEGIADLFTGQTVVAYANDPIAAPKVAVEFAKANDPDPGSASCSTYQRSGGPDRPRYRRARPEERGGLRPFLAVNSSNLYNRKYKNG